MPWKKLSGHISFFSIPIMYFQSHCGSFCRPFWRILHFAVIMDPFQMSFLAPKSYTLYSFIEMTECLQNCRFYRTIISNYASIVKWKQYKKIIKIRRLFCSWLTLRKRHYFEVVSPSDTIAFKNINIFIQSDFNQIVYLWFIQKFVI